MALPSSFEYANSTSSFPSFTVFISHAGEDKATIAIPLRQKLRDQGITSFVDEEDLPRGCDAVQGMTQAMERAHVGVVVLSPEFVARKWPMRELMCFLRRREEAAAQGRRGPIILPVFYRLGISDLYDEPRLDRLTSDGKSLYQTSRFFERRDKGEPEADITKVREALQQVHSIMGIRNDFDASNDSSYLMATRREILLGEIFRAVTNTIQPQNGDVDDGTGNVPEVSSQSSTFHAHFDQPPDTANLVLDFQSRDIHGKPNTIEGKVFVAVCDESSERNTSIAIEGMKGVGKTFLLYGLMTFPRLRTRFKGGIYFSRLGTNATFAHLKEVLSTSVEKAGGEAQAAQIRNETDWRQVISMVRSFFDGKQCLFMFDDVWEDGQVSSDVVRSLISLHRSVGHQNDEYKNKVIFTTRSLSIAARAGTPFSMEPFDALGHKARSMLYKYAGVAPNERDSQEILVIEDILRKCRGMPQYIADAGGAVRSLSNTTRGQGSLAYHLYAFSISGRMSSTSDIERPDR